MEDDCEVVFIAGLGKMLGRTEASVREGICRGVTWLPKSFRMGIRHCWFKEDIRDLLRAWRDRENKAPKVGRPRQTPTTLRDLKR